MSRKNPQEKKALSYTKDRRNTYGENDKGSRKSIRRNKRHPNRADRHRERQVLSTATGPTTAPAAAEQAEIKLLARKSSWATRRWRKLPDVPLADKVTRSLRRRAALGMTDHAAATATIARIHHRRR
jgi:hypothetical protein